MLNQEVCFNMLLFCTKCNKGTLVVFLVKNNKPKKKKYMYKYLVVLYYHQIWDLIFFSACFLGTGFVFIIGTD